MIDALKAKEVNFFDLEATVGGASQVDYGIRVGRTYYIHVETGYVALRTAPAYSTANEIGALWTGTEVVVTGYSGGEYATVTVNSAAKGPWGDDMTGRSGYVNVKYLET